MLQGPEITLTYTFKGDFCSFKSFEICTTFETIFLTGSNPPSMNNDKKTEFAIREDFPCLFFIDMIL